LNLEVSITGVTPNSTHGLHIHNYGDSTNAAGSSLGEHYNPYGFPMLAPMLLIDMLVIWGMSLPMKMETLMW